MAFEQYFISSQLCVDKRTLNLNLFFHYALTEKMKINMECNKTFFRLKKQVQVLLGLSPSW